MELHCTIHAASLPPKPWGNVAITVYNTLLLNNRANDQSQFLFLKVQHPKKVLSNRKTQLKRNMVFKTNWDLDSLRNQLHTNSNMRNCNITATKNPVYIKTNLLSQA